VAGSTQIEICWINQFDNMLTIEVAAPPKIGCPAVNGDDPLGGGTGPL